MTRGDSKLHDGRAGAGRWMPRTWLARPPTRPARRPDERSPTTRNQDSSMRAVRCAACMLDHGTGSRAGSWRNRCAGRGGETPACRRPARRGRPLVRAGRESWKSLRAVPVRNDVAGRLGAKSGVQCRLALAPACSGCWSGAGTVRVRTAVRTRRSGIPFNARRDRVVSQGGQSGSYRGSGTPCSAAAGTERAVRRPYRSRPGRALARCRSPIRARRRARRPAGTRTGRGGAGATRDRKRVAAVRCLIQAVSISRHASSHTPRPCAFRSRSMRSSSNSSDSDNTHP